MNDQPTQQPQTLADRIDLILRLGGVHSPIVRLALVEQILKAVVKMDREGTVRT